MINTYRGGYRGIHRGYRVTGVQGVQGYRLSKGQRTANEIVAVQAPTRSILATIVLIQYHIEIRGCIAMYCCVVGQPAGVAINRK